MTKPNARVLDPITIRADGGKPRVIIFGDIGASDWLFGNGDTVSAADFYRELDRPELQAAAEIDLEIFSAGGDVFEGMAIGNWISAHKAHWTATINSLCASIATIVALSCDKVQMMGRSEMMIHEAWGLARGGVDEVEEFKASLARTNDMMAQTYVTKTGIDEDEIRAMMKAETWFTTEQAHKRGFVDEIIATDMTLAAKVNMGEFTKRSWIEHPPSSLPGEGSPSIPALSPAMEFQRRAAQFRTEAAKLSASASSSGARATA